MNNSYHNVSNTTIPRDLRKLEEPTQNIYESISIISKRANQIGLDIKKDLQDRLLEVTHDNDNLEEVHENREQIEISAQFEKLPKPSLIATDEFLNGKVHFRNPARDAEK